MRILVIDDEEAVRTSFHLALEGLPYRLGTAATGEAGLEALRSEPADLIFLDLHMPGIDGVETLRRLRRAGIETPVYVITAFADEFMQRLQEAVDEGLDFELVRKPIELDDIANVVHEVLADESEIGVDGHAY